MKKHFLIVLASIALFSAQPLLAQDFSEPDKSPLDQTAFPTSHRASNKKARITYSRPQLKGREVSKLAPMDQVWRTGANEAVEVTLYAPLTVGGKNVKAGTYTMYTIPGATEWTVILNKDLNTWGAYSYNEANDVVRFTTPVKEGKESVEFFSMEFKDVEKGAHLHLGWGTTRLEIPFYTKK